jgi:hypothetical protein
MTSQPPIEIVADIGPLLAELAALGYVPREVTLSQSPDEYAIEFAGPRRLRLLRQGKQYLLDHLPRPDVRSGGAYRAFDNREAFDRAVLDWARRSASPADTGRGG